MAKQEEESWAERTYKKIMAGRPKKYDDAFFEEEIKNLIEWGEKEDSLVIMGWRADRAWTWAQIKDFCDMSEKFSEAYESVKAKIGRRREEMGLEGKAHAGLVIKNLWQYDAEHKAYEKEMRTAAGDSDGTAGMAIMAKMAKQLEKANRKIAELEAKNGKD